MHAAIEEQVFYPVTRATVPETEDIALESLEEHHIVKWVLSELDGMDPTDERFDAKVTVLIENVRHHVKEEETEYFPMVRDELGRNALADLGEAMVAARDAAPTHPHPRSPDTPPGNLVVGTAAGIADRVGDTVSGLAQGGAAAVADLVATILRRKTPQCLAVRHQGGAHDRDPASAAAPAMPPRPRPARSPRPPRPRPPVPSRRHGPPRPGRRAPRPRPARRPSARRATAKRGATTTGRTARKATKRTASTAKRGRHDHRLGPPARSRSAPPLPPTRG